MKDPRAGEAEQKRIDRFVIRINVIHPEYAERQNGDDRFDRGKEGMTKCLNCGAKNAVQRGNHLEGENVFQSFHAVEDSKLIAGNVERKHLFAAEEIDDRTHGGDRHGKDRAAHDRAFYTLSIACADILAHKGDER